jgi:hypothetical protein
MLGVDAMGMSRGDRQYVEHQCIHDIFVSDLTRVDVMGENVRFVLHVEQPLEEGGLSENIIVAKLVMPRAVVLTVIQRMMFALGMQSAEAFCRPPMRLS